jgi:hypothetical protein
VDDGTIFSCETEVSDLDDALLGQEQVAELDVPVDDEVLVDVGQSVEHL